MFKLTMQAAKGAPRKVFVNDAGVKVGEAIALPTTIMVWGRDLGYDDDDNLTSLDFADDFESAGRKIAAHEWEHARDAGLLTTVERTFDGTPLEEGVLIAEGTDPWIEVDGKSVTWPREGFLGAEGNNCECTGSPVPGVLTSMNSEAGIQRCDTCGLFPGDLEAALALAKFIGGVVKFEQEVLR